MRVLQTRFQGGLQQGLAGAALEDIRRRQQFDCAVAQAPVIWNANYLLSFNTVAAPSCCSGG